MKILYIANFYRINFQCDMIFHGLRSLFGEDCVDSNEAWLMYEGMREKYANRISAREMDKGRDFTLYGLLPHLKIDRTDLESKIKNHYFDKIIYGSHTRCMDYFNIVQLYYNTTDVIFINGEDDQHISTELCIYPYFKRELNYPITSKIRPINFCIPKERIVKTISEKTQDWATVIPGDRNTYKFSNEISYFEDYQKSYFGVTTKKGGWDCLRHYEILMNGCIPFFPDLNDCPEQTMVRFPKKLISDATNKIKNEEDLSFYNEYVTLLLEWTKKHLTTEEVAKDIIINEQ